MRILLTAFVSIIGLSAFAQTAIIAHKSHAGSSADFFSDPSANFGIPSPRLIQVVRVNDSVCVNVYSEYGGTIFHDTIYTRTSYDLDIDSVKTQSYRQNVEYVNFKHSPKHAKPKPPGNPQIQNNMYSDELQLEPQQEAPIKKKKKRSALLFIFLVTGGGLITLRLFNRLFASQPAS